MKVIFNNSQLVFAKVQETDYNYQSEGFFFKDNYILGSQSQVGNSFQTAESSYTDGRSGYYKIPVQKGNLVKAYVCRNSQYPQLYILDANNIVLAIIPCETGGNKIEEWEVEITQDNAAYFCAGNLGGTSVDTLYYQDTYVKRFGSVSE